MFVSRGLVVGFTVALAGLALTGCGTRLSKAPVEDRGTSSSASAPAPSTQPGVVVGAPLKPLPGAENAGKPGYYTVKPGDTLIRIGLESGQSWKDVARWNNLENPNLIEVGQVLRVAPPAPASQAVASDTGVVTRPFPGLPFNGTTVIGSKAALALPVQPKSAIVIGAGQAGPGLAYHLASTGRTVAIVEADKVGGTCLNRGCRPTKALRASARVAHLARTASRHGIHTGEVELIGDDVGGIAVNIGARIGAEAVAGEVLVSSTVRELVVGSGFEFADRGLRELKGVPGEWRLFAVGSPPA